MAKDEQLSNQRTCPYSHVNIFSQIAIWWMNPFFEKGYKQKLTTSDLYPLASYDSAGYLTEQLEINWNKELDNSNRSDKKPSFARAFFHTYKWKFLSYAILQLVWEICRCLGPLLIGELTLYFLNREDILLWYAYACAVGIAVTSIMATIIGQLFALKMHLIGWNARTAVVGLMYKKALKLNNDAFSQTTTGQIVNLSSTDAMRYNLAFYFAHYIWMAPLEAIIVTYILWRRIGPAALMGMSLMFLIMVIQAGMGKLFGKLRLKSAMATDRRVNVMSEVVSGMRIIKMYSWEKSFMEIVTELRKKEMRKIFLASLLRAFNYTMNHATCQSLSFATFMVVAATNGSITLQSVLVVVGLFIVLRLGVGIFFPIAIERFSEGRVTLKRTEAFLLLPELPPNKDEADVANQSKAVVKLEDFTGTWNSIGRCTLNNISIEVEKGKLVIVVGPVGAGKSSLLSAILKELPVHSGKVRVDGKIAYCSQIPWLLSDSIRNNIIFDEAFDENRYKNVIKVCALEKDLEILPSGDETLVGERGVTLSGGQKARVGLARMAYSLGCEVALFDDPLSAVDPSVANHLFEECICGFMKGKARILVTHQLQFLEKADQIVVLQEGEVADCGTFQELEAKGIDFKSLVEVDDETIKDGVSDTAINKSLTSTSMNMSRESLNNDGGEYRLASNVEKKAVEELDDDEDARTTLLQREECSVQFSGTSTKLAKTTEIKQSAEEPVSKAATGIAAYYQYFKFGAHVLLLVVLLLIALANHTFLLMSDWWLTHWAYQSELYQQDLQSTIMMQQAMQNNKSTVPQNIENLTSINETFTVSDQLITNGTEGIATTLPVLPTTIEPFNQQYYVVLYAVFTVGFLLTMYSRCVFHFYVCIRSSIQLHAGMLAAMLKAKIRFFDTNPVGGVLNRFSKDMNQVDELLPLAMIDVLFLGGSMFTIIVYISVINYFIIIVVIPMVLYFVWIFRYYIKTSREIKRMEGSTRSPVFGHLSSTLQGLVLIRSFKAQRTFVEKYHRLQDVHGASWSAFVYGSRWFGFRLDMMMALFVGVCAISSVLLISVLPDDFPINAGNLGLTLTYAISLLSAFQWSVRQSAEVENLMTSVERICEYHNIPSESDPGEKAEKPPADWPKSGSISLSDVSYAYFKGGPQVLRNVTVHIKAQEKLGIVGRTGAGKSSVIAAIFRMSDHVTGRITIDGIDTSNITLQDLRSALAIIPQDPVLFGGTLRKNLDAFSSFTDEHLWKVLEQVQLKSLVEDLPLKLETELNESGSNLSVGQRQLVCLARAILRNNKILIIDEATANVDMRTDHLIQETIAERFSHCTVLTIAHRLNTIINSDRILVLDNGEVVECDHPHKLLSKPGGGFTQMVKMAGDQEAQLRKAAEKTFYKNNAELE